MELAARAIGGAALMLLVGGIASDLQARPLFFWDSVEGSSEFLLQSVENGDVSDDAHVRVKCPEGKVSLVEIGANVGNSGLGDGKGEKLTVKLTSGPHSVTLIGQSRKASNSPRSALQLRLPFSDPRYRQFFKVLEADQPIRVSGSFVAVWPTPAHFGGMVWFGEGCASG